MTSKILSLQALNDCGLPTLPFMVLHEDVTIGQLKNFTTEHKVQKIMVRSDGKGNFSPHFNNAEVNYWLLSQIKNLFDQGYKVFVMTPGDIYKDMHSLNIMVQPQKVSIEVVGPGFIATDLNRDGYIHESIHLNPDNFDIISRKIMVTEDEYENDRQKKILNLGLKNITDADGYILKYKNYPPISDEEMDFVKGSIPKLNKASKLLKPNCEAYVASLSFANLGGETDPPVFWDIYTL